MMDRDLANNQLENALLLKQFNSRDNDAFVKIYTMFCRELNIYALSLFGLNNQFSEDTVEDAFINLWLSKNEFSSLDLIKGYLYISIRNSFFKYHRHKKYVIKHRDYIEKQEDFIVDIVEAKIYSLVDEALNILPQNHAEVLERYLEGWKTGEIALSMGKPEQTIYNIKHEAIKILRKKISKDKLLIIMILLGKVDF